MIIFKNYNLDDDDIEFFLQMYDWCINGQSELILEYKGQSFVIEPSGKSVKVVVAVDRTIGEYESFDDLFLNHKIDGKPLIELIKELEFGD